MLRVRRVLLPDQLNLWYVDAKVGYHKPWLHTQGWLYQRSNRLVMCVQVLDELGALPDEEALRQRGKNSRGKC
jgi:hypothetical protein